MAHEYLTATELEATLELSGTSFADDDITLAISAASKAVEYATNRRFWADADVNQVRYYTAMSEEEVWIDDLVALTELATSPGGDNVFSDVWTVNSDFYLEPLNAAADGWPYTKVRVSLRSGLWLPCYVRSVRVTGKFGWSAVPDGVKQAAKLIASRLVKRSREAPFGVVSMGMDAGAAQIAREDSDVQAILGPFVRENHS